MSRTATLAQPLLLPTAAGYAVVADDAPGPFPRIGDVARGRRGWLAWPMGAEMKTPFPTRREAVEFLTRTAA